ncbi:MAG: homoserine O-acetyltransferase [Bacteroidota bacterium]
MTLNTILIDTYKASTVKTWTSEAEFPLECGKTLPSIDIAYCTYGKLNATKSNVVWVCHALTANADAMDWWDGLISKGKLFDPTEYFIVCSNMLGSCYGATCPSSINLETGEPYHQNFPLITIRDIVNAHKLLRQKLGIQKIDVILGGSMGGQQVLEWAIQEPQLFKHVIPIATNAKHSPWAIAFNETQRMAMEADETLFTHAPNAGHKGLEAARAIAMLSYRHYQTYDQSQQDATAKIDDYRASSYQKYQGLKLRKRFEPLAYYGLSKSMDTQDVGRGRGGLKKALAKITARTLVIGITSDILFPPKEQKFIAKHVKGAVYKKVKSTFGHDGFLIEYAQLTTVIKKFLRNK